LYLDNWSTFKYYPQEKYIFINLSNDWPKSAPYKGHLALEKTLEAELHEGHFEFRFKPTVTYPYNGKTILKMYSSSDPTDHYYFMIGRSDSLGPYNTSLQKRVDDIPVINYQLVPTPPQFNYSLKQWHTFAIDFSPSKFTGYLDGKEVLTGNDPKAHAIKVDTINIHFYQQDEYLDDLYVSGKSSTGYLTSDTLTLSARAGGKINFTLTASDHPNRDYLLLGTTSGTEPGALLPGGWVSFPLNFDYLTAYVYSKLNSPTFLNFQGVLDSTGSSMAQIDTAGICPIPSGCSGIKMYFAYALYYPCDFVSKPVMIEIEP